MDLIRKFNDKLNELEVKNCSACNYTMQSQKEHVGFGIGLFLTKTSSYTLTRQ